MRKYYFLLSLFFTPIAIAETTSSNYNWNGFYLGATTGAAFTNFNNKTSTQPGALLNNAATNAVNNAGNQNIVTSGFLSGIEGGYNWQVKQWLFGLETDIQALSNSDQTNSGAVVNPANTSQQFVITSYSSNNWSLTIRPRIGITANNLLFYATGGLGLAYLQSDFLFTTNTANFESQRVNKVVPGYVVGAGVEAGLTNNISLKAEYLFEDFNQADASNMNHHVPANQNFTNSTSMKSNILKLGINYHFNQQVLTKQSSALYLPMFDFTSDQWQTETGLRIFSSSGIDGAPQPLFNTSNIGNILASRLIFSDLTAVSAELFSRLDHKNGMFVKGYLGAGSITNGQLNDEDFPAGGAYSNTLSNASGNLSYATVDLGYSFLKIPSAKTGIFIGYNYYAQNIGITSCQQLAGAGVCADSAALSNFLALSQQDKWNSLRIGLSSQFHLSDQLTLTSEAAYLPVVNYDGLDQHNARQLLGPESSSNGDGAMLETLLDYQFSHSWSVGIGGRYWMWNMHDGNTFFEFLGINGGSVSEPVRLNTDRYGVFLQMSYRDRDLIKFDSAAIDWQGVFVGANLAGGWGENNWSDPFGSTPGDPGFMNVAGFGDQIQSTGPLGGVNLNFNWQTSRFVYSVGINANTADVRGENTLFSGLGGINGETIINYFGTVVGRIGVPFYRSLFYIDGGRALLNTTCKLNGNTTVLTLGSENETINRWGWTGGVGVEYAFSSHWTSNVEYDYIHAPGHVSFDEVDVINEHRYSIDQTLNVVKLGVNYKV